MNAALVTGGAVANVIILPDGTKLTPTLAESFGGELLAAVPDGTPVGPGWAYDGEFTPPPPAPLAAPAGPDAAAVFPVLVAAAADPAMTLDEKVAAIVQALADAAPAPLDPTV